MSGRYAFPRSLRVDSETTIETVVTYLEMLAPPKKPMSPAPLGKLAILRAEEPTVSYYRYLYQAVGDPWNWVDRRLLDDEALARIIRDPKVEIYVLYVAGVPAGFAEHDRRHGRDIELAYFGLVPEFVGRGLGSYFLDWAVNVAWSRKPKRLWVHTCTLDHPRALAAYQRAGFHVYDRTVERVPALVEAD